MKRFLSIIILFAILCCCNFTYAESYLSDIDSFLFTPVITNSMSLTSSEWISSESNRALISVMLCVEGFAYSDEAITAEEGKEWLHNPIYVGKADNTIVAAGRSNSRIIVFTIQPIVEDGSSNNAFCIMSPLTTTYSTYANEDVISKLQESVGDNYYENDSELVLKYFNEILSYFS